MKRFISLAMVCALSLSLLAGCGKGKNGGDSTFTVALDSDIVALDPAFAYDFTTNPVINQITEGLLTFDENNELVPWLASDWSQTDDTTYVYTIRDDVCFSDGTPMTMDDVMFSLERTMNPDTGSYLQWMFSPVESIEQTGDWELTVKLSQPSATWQYVFGTTAGHIISKAYYEEHADNFGTAEGGILGTGPYKFESWSSGQNIVLTKNENYWDDSADIQIDRLVFNVIPEDTTRVTALQSGQVDFTASTPPDMLETLENDENLQVQSIPTMGVTFLAFNTQRAPFNDVNVRKAIYSAIDVADIKENIVKDTGETATLLPNGPALFTSSTDAWNEYAQEHPAYTYDLDQAKEYLAASDYPDGFDCTLLTTEASIRYSMALAIQEDLKALNINVEIVRVSADEHTAYQFGNILDADGNRDFDMIIAGWESDYPDIAGNIEPLYSSANTGEGGSNTAVYVNDQVDELIALQSQTTDPDQRSEYLFQALDIITEDIPYIFLEYPNRQVTMQNGYEGFTLNASWLWNLQFKNIHQVQTGD